MAEALGDGWANGLHPEDRYNVLSNWQQMVASEGHWGSEYRFQTPAGEITWVYGLAVPQRDAMGNIVAYVGINSDITERKQAEETILDSEQRFRAAFTASPMAIAISTQQEGKWIDVNQAALDVFGYTRDELVGESALSTNFWVDQNDRKKIVEKMNQGTEVRNQHVHLRRKDGSLIDASISANTMTLKGVKHVLFITEDITERKLNWQRLR